MVPVEYRHGEETITFAVRDYEPIIDDAIVFDPWLRGVAEAAPISDFTREELKRHRAEVVVPTLARVGALIACDAQMPDCVYGWACAEIIGDLRVCHFAYTKRGLRRKRLATTLLTGLLPGFEKFPTYYTHTTADAPRFMEATNGRFNPYIAIQAQARGIQAQARRDWDSRG